jgi:anti-anti-sigma factor
MIAAHQTWVIFDMAGVTHADSAAIGTIVRCLTKLKGAGGALRIAAIQTMLAYSLKLAKVDNLIEIFPTVELAAKGFSAPDASASQQA